MTNDVFFPDQAACQNWEEQGKTLSVKAMQNQALNTNDLNLFYKNQENVSDMADIMCSYKNIERLG